MNIAFKGIIPIVGTPQEISLINDELSKIKKTSNFVHISQNATDLYKNHPKEAKPESLIKLVKNGKEVLFLITGNDVKKVICSERGYTSLCTLARKISDPVIQLKGDIYSTLSQLMKLIKKI